MARIITLGLVLSRLSLVSKWLGKVGSNTEGIGIRYAEVIREVVDPREAERIRDEIINDYHLIVEEISVPEKPQRDGWSEWRRCIDKAADKQEQIFSRGETVVSLSLAIVAVPLGFLPLNSITSVAVSALFLFLGGILALAVSLRIAVMDLLAFTDPPSRDTIQLKNMWAWNYWILGQTAVIVVILGIVVVGRMNQELRDATVREVREIPREAAKGNDVNLQKFLKRLTSEAVDIYLKNQLEED